ncbi:MAG TPA: hypothetical protein VGP86_11225 [Xanthobacteraceae bacterium]|nr:hypothetical protein [Xanthobacteraceae bacterium]
MRIIASAVSPAATSSGVKSRTPPRPNNPYMVEPSPIFVQAKRWCKTGNNQGPEYGTVWPNRAAHGQNIELMDQIENEMVH